MKVLQALALASALCITFPVGIAQAQDTAQFEMAKSGEVLQAGTVIPATLVTGLTSDNMDSLVTAVVRQNVYDSVTGNNLLIPAGSKLIGEPMQMQGARINIAFTRIIFPNGLSVMLPEVKAVDGVGYSGLKDKYTTHSWAKIRSVFTGAIFAGASGSVSNRSTSNNSDNESVGDSAMKTAIAQLITGVSNIAQQEAGSIRPTGTIREGYQFNIMLNEDIKIRPYR